MTSGISRTMLRIIPSGPDVEISSHADDQYYTWLATETVECHIKFSSEKSNSL